MLLLTYSWSVSTGKEPNPFYGYLWQSTLNWSPVCLLNTTLILICSEAVDDIYDFFLLSLSACFFGSQLFGVHCQVNGQTFPFGSSVSLPFFFFLFDVIFHQFLILEIEVLRGIPENTLTEFFLPSLCCSNSDSSCSLWQSPQSVEWPLLCFKGPKC